MKAPAKINLTLDVLHKRTDGYHEVEMVMTTVDLADRIELSPLPGTDIQVRSSVSYVPCDERNLAYQAAKLLQKLFRVQQGVSIYIEKKIPVAAGLAGGSSDAAGTIKGLNDLWQLGLTTEEMAQLGAQIGSDVAFCVYGGTALARGRGEIITPLPSPPPFWVTLAKPSVGVSTKNIYQKLKPDHLQSGVDTARMIQAIEQGCFEAICANLGNALESVTFREYPEVAFIKQRMKSFGGEGVLMTGSGPTVFALTQKESRARRIYNGLKGFCKEVFLVRSLAQT